MKEYFFIHVQVSISCLLCILPFTKGELPPLFAYWSSSRLPRIALEGEAIRLQRFCVLVSFPSYCIALCIHAGVALGDEFFHHHCFEEPIVGLFDGKRMQTLV